MNKITIYFQTCSPAPSRGYAIYYRVAGSGGVWIKAGNFFQSPAVFYDTVNPAGTCYEGMLFSDCIKTFGTEVSWQSCQESGGSFTPSDTLHFGAIMHPGINIGVGNTLQVYYGTVSGIDTTVTINQFFIDGFDGLNCTGTAVASAQLHNGVILPGQNSPGGGSSSETGDWSLAVSFSVVPNPVITVASPPYFATVIDGQIIPMGTYNIQIVFDGC